METLLGLAYRGTLVYEYTLTERIVRSFLRETAMCRIPAKGKKTSYNGGGIKTFFYLRV